MTVSTGYGNIVLAVIGIVIVAVAAVLVVSVFAGDPPAKELILKDIELRNSKDALDRASLVTNLDNLVLDADNDAVTEQWQRMLECLSSACPDEAFLDMALVVTSEFESEFDESALLINVIATAKYWGKPENMLDFSKALSIANDQIEELGLRNAEKTWQDIVECNNECPERNDLYFDLIGSIVK